MSEEHEKPIPLQYGVRPKGSMCMNCEYLNTFCGDLDYRNMPVIGIEKDGTRIVKCTSYE